MRLVLWWRLCCWNSDECSLTNENIEQWQLTCMTIFFLFTEMSMFSNENKWKCDSWRAWHVGGTERARGLCQAINLKFVLVSILRITQKEAFLSQFLLKRTQASVCAQTVCTNGFLHSKHMLFPSLSHMQIIISIQPSGPNPSSNPQSEASPASQRLSLSHWNHQGDPKQV